MSHGSQSSVPIPWIEKRQAVGERGGSVEEIFENKIREPTSLTFAPSFSAYYHLPSFIHLLVEATLQYDKDREVHGAVYLFLQCALRVQLGIRCYSALKTALRRYTK